MTILIVLGLSILGGILYRIGGSDWGNTKWRDLGVPAVMIAVMYEIGAITDFWTGISLIPCFLALFASLTTYFKKGPDANWINWAMVGFFTAASMIFYAWASGHWIGFGARCILNTVLITIWSKKIDEVNAEEFGRGFIIISTLPLLLF